MKGVGRAVFVAILLLIAGVLNVIYGIAALGNGHFFTGTVYAFSTLHTVWSVGIFAICLWVLHGLVIYGTQDA